MTGSRQALVFILQSIIAGLAIAFVFLYFFPGATSSKSQRGFEEWNNKGGPTQQGPVSYNQAVAASAPAVVNVYATKIIQRRTHPLLQDPLFRRFFGDQGSGPQRNTNLGSGVIMSAEGHLVTNAHVIKGADDILITLADGRQTMAEVVGVDPETDLAVLHIDIEDVPIAPLGDSTRIAVGDVVLAIGNPYDFGQTVTQGIISATGRKRLGITTFEDFIQTDADINPGNSGGALINMKGEVIGINTAIRSTSGGSQGINFAIPVNLAIDVMQALLQHGHVIRGWLGIEAQVLPQGSGQQHGVLVAGILQDGPAENAGILPGDIITQINNIPLYDPHQAIQMIAQNQPGERIELVIIRGWEEMVVRASVTQRPAIIQ